ncbi:hypothetical protein O1611_g6246 [Lasiodiplodia mahajangana]|uniref:Uncharacterized protein n=1 Tax=Lasiodiplodia mahajangana TaxID=1108764 RepID=A0ACC2JJ52_9PEZI|nr:hypothetical protein O1611_g6246 [Lasiodiplodia mahajangana]
MADVSTETPASVSALPPLKTRIWGHHHTTALIAGGIIANNAFDDVYFSFDQYGRNPAKTPRDGILEPGKYWLQLNSITDSLSSTPKAIAEGMATTTYPPYTARYSPPGSRCGGKPLLFISDINIGLEKCHLIPEAQQEWFMRNEMHGDAQASAVHKIQDPANIMMLLSHLNLAFDRSVFVITPKPSTSFSSSASRLTSTTPSTLTVPSTSTTSPTSENKPQSNAFVTHVISATPEACDLTELYHNRSIQDFLRTTSVRELRIVDGEQYISKSLTGQYFAELREERVENVNRSRKRRRGSGDQDGEPTDDDDTDEGDVYGERWGRRCANLHRQLSALNNFDVIRERSTSPDSWDGGPDSFP